MIRGKEPFVFGSLVVKGDSDFSILDESRRDVIVDSYIRKIKLFCMSINLNYIVD